MTTPQTPSGPVATLFEHHDGRYAVAPGTESPAFTLGEPAWHRVGPVDISALAVGSPSSAVGEREASLLSDAHDQLHRLVAVFVPSNDGAYAETTALMGRLRAALAAISAPAAEQQAAPRTPSSHWNANGETDPHAGHYDGERAALCMGSLTDDELANGAFMNYDRRPHPQEIIAGTAHSPIAWMTAVKDRIRWLSRALERAQAAAPVVQAAEQQAGVPGDDVADLIAGGLGVSRAYAYEAMAKALNDSGHWSAHRAQQAGAGLGDALRAKVEPSDAEILKLSFAFLGDTGPQDTRVLNFSHALLALQGAKLAEPSTMPAKGGA